MKNVILDGVRKILDKIIWQILKTLWNFMIAYSLLHHNKVIALEVLQYDVKYISKESSYKTYYPILQLWTKILVLLLSCQNKTYCS